MKLIGAIASPYVARCVMFARLKGIELPLEPAPGGMGSDEYRAFNATGKIPSLDVDGVCIPESEVICEYLEDRFPEPSGLPANPLSRATSRTISRVTDLYIAPHNAGLMRQANPQTRDQAVVDKAAAEFAKGFAYLEAFMGDGPFCAGTEPTLGDCSAGPYMVLMKHTVFPVFSEIPDPTTDGRLGEWWAAMQEHAVARAVLDEYEEGLEGFLKWLRSKIDG